MNTIELNKSNDNFVLDGTGYDIIESKNVIEIQIIGDGNCFFRCLSQNLEKTQENHRYYRDLIYNYIIDNRNQFQRFYPKKENETNENYEIRYNTFISAIHNNGNFAGDFEIATAAIVLKRKL